MPYAPAQTAVLIASLLDLILFHLPQESGLWDATGYDSTKDLLGETQRTDLGFPVRDVCTTMSTFGDGC